MTNAIDINKIRSELVYFLRNKDIFTITQRGVATATATGTWTGATDHKISVTNIKNIRSITVDAIPLTYGKDYTYDVNFLDTTIKTKITLNTAQTGAYIITYDYGSSDKIYPDFPKPNQTISSFPRIGADIINIPTQAGGFGNVNVSTIDMMIVVYDFKTKDISDYITKIRTAIIDAQTSFYFLGKAVKPINVGPVLKSPREKGKDKIFQQNIDIRGLFNYEKN